MKFLRVKDIVCSPSDNSFVCSLSNTVESQPGTVVIYNLKTLQQTVSDSISLFGKKKFLG